jgi:superfamily II DNA or RNA helicase
VPIASYSQLIDEGAIVAPIAYRARVLPDLKNVRKVAGDFHEGELEEAMMGVHVIGDVVRDWMARAERRRTVVYCVGIEHSRALTEEFREAGVRVAHLDGTTPIPERDQILVDLYLGKLEMVCNVGVLTEGWDCPPVKCCVMARPTLSLTLWMQCAGRILRPWEGVTPMVLDHSGNVERHFLPHMDREWSLDGKVTTPREATRYHVCAGCYAYVDRMPCPLCGHTLQRQERKVVKKDGVLEEVKAKVDAAVKAQRESDPKRLLFDTQAEVARKNGFKPGYAAAKYKEKFSDWPPWAWSQALKQYYASDSFWQERVAKRERERAYWQDRQKAAEDLSAAAAALPPEDLPDDGIPF